jgi:hypothetical protein
VLAPAIAMQPPGGAALPETARHRGPLLAAVLSADHHVIEADDPPHASCWRDIARHGAWMGKGLTRLYGDFFHFPFLIFRHDAGVDEGLRARHRRAAGPHHPEA